jgi:hypothetical protein
MPSSKAAPPSSRSHYDHSRRKDASVGHTRIWDKRLSRHAADCVSAPTDRSQSPSLSSDFNHVMTLSMSSLTFCLHLPAPPPPFPLAII